MTKIFNFKKPVETDRIVFISSDDIDEFKKNPEDYLNKIGALEGLASFNGLDWSEYEESKVQNQIEILCTHRCDCVWIPCG